MCKKGVRIKAIFHIFFGVFKHDKLVQLLPESFKQKRKLNPVSRARQSGKRGKNNQKNQFFANLQHCRQKLNQWYVPLKSSGLEFKRARGATRGGRGLQHIIRNIEVVRLEFSRFGGVKNRKHDCKVEEHIQICTQIYNI